MSENKPVLTDYSKHSTTRKCCPATEIPPHSSNEYRFPPLWRLFKREIKSPRPFNPFAWTCKLVSAALHDLGAATGCSLQRARPFLPLFAITLVFFVLITYFASLRTAILPRWCSNPSMIETRVTRVDEDEHNECAWMYIHDSFVLYLGFMILYHFISASCGSPGFALATAFENEKSSVVGEWTFTSCLSGVVGLGSNVDELKEAHRVSLYGTLQLETVPDTPVCELSLDTCRDLHQTSYATFCKKCRIVRPPRCHHCSTCDRCVLQFDHHCVWLNNCIGFYNYRSFVLTLFFLLVGCTYGTALLFWPFYEPLRAQVKEFGWKWMYSNGTGFLNLPSPKSCIRMLLGLDPIEISSKEIVDIVFPLVSGIGAAMAGFFGFHCKLMALGLTSLEYRIFMQQRLFQYIHQNTRNTKPIANPFDRGCYINVVQVLGRPLWHIFLPLPARPTPPYS